ncbi:MAG: hypothetical protein MZU91_01485 [Desulfosudis oleivorans]|nr:hypothetical protein [Desulfosudis oleivorans]
MGSRSMLQIMLAFASYVDVPESDLKRRARGSVVTIPNTDPVRIKCSKDKPAGGLCRRALPQSMVLGGRPRSGAS